MSPPCDDRVGLACKIDGADKTWFLRVRVAIPHDRIIIKVMSNIDNC